ncbi:MAG TPA: SDR family NAD(P)-dependent oxidoreductase, partial [Pyrinomonadaceae bacterium]|nr:SDR family NAD(P)-dependent oxidoreductase [Pyrinomonadaceae bacterium]
MKLKRLEDQVIVITGASSGIGLVTARMAAKRGAKLVLVARAEDALKTLTEELKASGADVIYVKADVGVESQMREVRDAT